MVISAEIIMIVRMTFFTVSMTFVLQFILNLEYNNADAATIQECQMCTDAGGVILTEAWIYDSRYLNKGKKIWEREKTLTLKEQQGWVI